MWVSPAEFDTFSAYFLERFWKRAVFGFFDIILPLIDARFPKAFYASRQVSAAFLILIQQVET